MAAFGHIAQCSDLAEADVIAGCESREAFIALLTRLAQVSKPASGAASVLTVFARLASSACGWLDGDLAIELLDEDENTLIRVMTELGAGMRERLLPPLHFRAPLAEFSNAINAQPAVVGALNVRRASWKRINLLVTEQLRRSTVPPRVAIADTSLWAAQPEDEEAPLSDRAPLSARSPIVSRAKAAPPRKPPATGEDSNADKNIDDLTKGWDDT